MENPIKVTEVNEKLTLMFPHLLRARSNRQLTISGRDKKNLILQTMLSLPTSAIPIQ
jgi:hypothetical protein